MSLSIEQIVLHQLVRHEENQLEMVLRDTPLVNNQAIEVMMTEINHVYSGKSKTFSLFTATSELAKAISSYRAGEQDFLTFTQWSMGRLRDELSKYPFAEEGTVIFCQYRYLAVEYLLIAVVNSCNSMRVNETLDVTLTHYLDINRADIVARIDLTDWERNPDSIRYLSFLKGRVGRKVADFFLDFLAADEGLDTKMQNQCLLQAVDDYCDQNELDKNERHGYRQQVYSYCNEQLQNGKEIEIQAMPAVGEQSFKQFSREQGYPLEENFPVDRTIVRQLTKFSGSGGGITVNFDGLLLGERVFWDPDTDTLTIKGTPPNLRDQLQRRFGRN